MWMVKSILSRFNTTFWIQNTSTAAKSPPLSVSSFPVLHQICYSPYFDRNEWARILSIHMLGMFSAHCSLEFWQNSCRDHAEPKHGKIYSFHSSIFRHFCTFFTGFAFCWRATEYFGATVGCLEHRAHTDGQQGRTVLQERFQKFVKGVVALIGARRSRHHWPQRSRWYIRYEGGQTPILWTGGLCSRGYWDLSV